MKVSIPVSDVVIETEKTSSRQPGVCRFSLQYFMLFSA
jgi:hypothetical protein